MSSTISPSTLSIASTIQMPSASTDALQKAASGANDDKKIDKSAQDFESILLENWLQGAEDSFAKVPGTDDEEDTDSGGGQFLQMGMQSLGAAMAASGGIGIAKMIAKQLHKSEDTAAAPAGTSTVSSAGTAPQKLSSSH